MLCWIDFRFPCSSAIRTIPMKQVIEGKNIDIAIYSKNLYFILLQFSKFIFLKTTFDLVDC